MMTMGGGVKRLFDRRSMQAIVEAAELEFEYSDGKSLTRLVTGNCFRGKLSIIRLEHTDVDSVNY